MNCEQDDVAIVVRAINPNNLGKICRCLKLIPNEPMLDPDGVLRLYNVWETDTVFEGWNGQEGTDIDDQSLKPLRDSEGEDEMLRISGKPVKKTEKV